jgi:hypothetical protein
MSLKPKTVVGQIELCEEHVTPFTDNAVAIGSSAPVVAAFVAKTEAARAASVFATNAATTGADDPMATALSVKGVTCSSHSSI